MSVVGRSELVVRQAPATAADSTADPLVAARATWKSALQARDRAREAHLAAQRAVDEVRALVRRLEQRS